MQNKLEGHPYQTVETERQCTIVSTQYQHCTDGRTDRQTDISEYYNSISLCMLMHADAQYNLIRELTANYKVTR